MKLFKVINNDGSYCNRKTINFWKIIQENDGKFSLIGCNIQNSKYGYVHVPILGWPHEFDTYEAAMVELYEIIKDENKEVTELQGEVRELKRKINELIEMVKTLPVVCGTDYLEGARRYAENDRVNVE